MTVNAPIVIFTYRRKINVLINSLLRNGEQARVRTVQRLLQQLVIKQYQAVYEKVLKNKNEI